MRAVKTAIVLMSLGLLLAACSDSGTATQTAKPPDESAALDAVRKTNEAQATYFKMNRRYALTYEELVQARLLASEPSPAQIGYDFKLRPAADAQTYKLVVIPGDSSASSARRFFLDQSGVIHAETGKEATADSPEVK